MVAVVLDSSREESYSKPDTQGYISAVTGILIIVILLYFFSVSIQALDVLGKSSLRMANYYIEGAAQKQGAKTRLQGSVFDFRL